MAGLTLPRPGSLPSPRRVADTLVTAVFVLAAVLLALLVGGRILGYQAMIERSDSMAPAIRSGDLILTGRLSAGRVRVGDVITFPNVFRPERTITHRVTRIERGADRLTFTTRGDAARGDGASPAERWSARPETATQRLTARLPGVGYAAALLAHPLVRLVALSFTSIALGVVAVRWIWSR